MNGVSNPKANTHQPTIKWRLMVGVTIVALLRQSVEDLRWASWWSSRKSVILGVILSRSPSFFFWILVLRNVAAGGMRCIKGVQLVTVGGVRSPTLCALTCPHE
jgi:hypothetical protein